MLPPPSYMDRISAMNSYIVGPGKGIHVIRNGKPAEDLSSKCLTQAGNGFTLRTQAGESLALEVKTD